MTINELKEGNKLTIALSGRIDTITAPELEQVINSGLNGINELIFDLAELEYMSSAGLRVMLTAKKKMDTQGGKMTVCNVNETIMEIFEITGFADILTIE